MMKTLAKTASSNGMRIYNQFFYNSTKICKGICVVEEEHSGTGIFGVKKAWFFRLPLAYQDVHHKTRVAQAETRLKVKAGNARR